MAGSKSLFHVCAPLKSKNANFSVFYKFCCFVSWLKGGRGQGTMAPPSMLLIIIAYAHRWAQLTQKLASLTTILLIGKINFGNANPITQIFCKWKLMLIC